jgi:hypothetical protein
LYKVVQLNPSGSRILARSREERCVTPSDHEHHHTPHHFISKLRIKMVAEKESWQYSSLYSVVEDGSTLPLRGICTVHGSWQGRTLKGQTPGSRGTRYLQISNSLDCFGHKPGTPAPGTGYLRSPRLASGWWGSIKQASDWLHILEALTACSFRLFISGHIQNVARVLIRYLRPLQRKKSNETTHQQLQELDALSQRGECFILFVDIYLLYSFHCS